MSTITRDLILAVIMLVLSAVFISALTIKEAADRREMREQGK